MIRVAILLAAALFFGGLSIWSIWLAATVDGRWGMLTAVTLPATVAFFGTAAQEARP